MSEEPQQESMMEWLWYDKSLGPRGCGAWFFAAGAGAFAWAVYLLISLILDRNLPVRVALIFSFCAIFSAVMTLLGLIYIRQTARTAQRICVINGDYRVHCYLLGRVLYFHPSDVTDIQRFNLNPYFNIPIFMNGENTNFRIYLASGSNFYLNGAVEGTERLVADLKQSMPKG